MVVKCVVKVRALVREKGVLEAEAQDWGRNEEVGGSIQVAFEYN